MDKPCVYCEEPMQNRVRTRAKFCSVTCKDKARSEARQLALVAARGERFCANCGGLIAGSRHGQSRFCSQSCYARNYNVAKAARLKAERLAKVGPCRICGDPIPASRTARAIYCSEACSRRAATAVKAKWSPGYNRRYLYGITPEQYAARLEEQGNRCAICRTDSPGAGKSWHVDHDHETNRIRGLLCNNCNHGLGKFKDDPARLQAAITYLAGPPCAASSPQPSGSPSRRAFWLGSRNRRCGKCLAKRVSGTHSIEEFTCAA